MDFYAVLGLAPGASSADIKRAYRRLARRYHPGINPGDRAAEALFQHITEAYATLAVSFMEAMRGIQRQVVVTRQEICLACRGSGSVSTPEARCVPCHGTG